MNAVNSHLAEEKSIKDENECHLTDIGGLNFTGLQVTGATEWSYK